MPDSKLDKRIKNARLHLKRAEQGKSAKQRNPYTIAEKRAELEELLMVKEANRLKHENNG